VLPVRGKVESGKENVYSCVVLAGGRSMDERRRALAAFKEVRVLSRPNDISYATGSYKPSAERIDQ
jgi:hypothetical protein